MDKVLHFTSWIDIRNNFQEDIFLENIFSINTEILHETNGGQKLVYHDHQKKVLYFKKQKKIIYYTCYVIWSLCPKRMWMLFPRFARWMKQHSSNCAWKNQFTVSREHMFSKLQTARTPWFSNKGNAPMNWKLCVDPASK